MVEDCNIQNVEDDKELKSEDQEVSEESYQILRCEICRWDISLYKFKIIMTIIRKDNISIILERILKQIHNFNNIFNQKFIKRNYKRLINNKRKIKAKEKIQNLHQ